MNYISKEKCRLIEGQLRVRELNEFLDKPGVHKFIWICEDATGIVSRIEHDPNTNQLVGLVLPIDSKTGIPIPFRYMADTAEQIQKFMEYEKATHVYLVLAQSLVEGVPPFILQIFGNSHKFKAVDVLKRWQHTTEYLQK